MYGALNFDLPYSEPPNHTVARQIVAAFVCPGEPKGQELVQHSFGLTAPTNYGWCMGDWFVWGV